MTGLTKHWRNMGTFGAALLLAAVAITAGAAKASAQADFYKGKTLTVMIASNPGGGTDTTGRLIARFWSAHIPGKPEILIRNKGVQILAANDLHHNTRPDGLTVGVFAGSGSLGPVARKSQNVKYDPLEWGIVGAIDRGSSILVIRKSVLPRLGNRSTSVVALGSVSTDRMQDAMAVFGSEYLGWNIKFILGYPSSSQMYLAFERGEIDMFGSGTADILNRFIKDGEAVPLVGEAKREDYSDVATFEQLLGDKKPSDTDWQAYLAWGGADSVDKYFALPPKTPEALLAVLRSSFLATLADADFKQQAEVVLADGFSAVSGEATRERIKTAIIIPEEVVGRIRDLRKKYGLPLVTEQK